MLLYPNFSCAWLYLVQLSLPHLTSGPFWHEGRFALILLLLFPDRMIPRHSSRRPSYRQTELMGLGLGVQSPPISPQKICFQSKHDTLRCTEEAALGGSNLLEALE